jgi:hypothetical protein
MRWPVKIRSGIESKRGAIASNFAAELIEKISERHAEHHADEKKRKRE